MLMDDIDYFIRAEQSKTHTAILNVSAIHITAILLECSMRNKKLIK